MITGTTLEQYSSFMCIYQVTILSLEYIVRFGFARVCVIYMYMYMYVICVYMHRTPANKMNEEDVILVFIVHVQEGV